MTMPHTSNLREACIGGLQRKMSYHNSDTFIRSIRMEFGCLGKGKGPWDGIGAVVKTKNRKDIINNIAARLRTTPSGRITKALEVMTSSSHTHVLFNTQQHTDNQPVTITIYMLIYALRVAFNSHGVPFALLRALCRWYSIFDTYSPHTSGFKSIHT